MPPSSPNVPLDVILKATVDKSGSGDVKDFLEDYVKNTKGAEESVSRTSELLDRMSGQVTRMAEPLRQFGGLIGIAGMGAAYHQYLQATGLGAQAALAQGQVTGGQAQFMPYTNQLLGIQGKTGVQASGIEEGLRTVAQMAGSSLSAEGAGRFGALLAGASLTSGMSASAVSQIVGSFLQSSGMSGGVGGAGSAATNATALMAGVSQALSAFPGSQKEAILPAVANLLQGQAIGAGATGRNLQGSAAESAAYLNSLAQTNSLFRNPQIAEGGTGALRSYLTGSLSNPRALAIIGGSGVSLNQALEGGPEAQAALVQHMSELWGPETTLGLYSNLGPEGALTAQTILKNISKAGGLSKYDAQLKNAAKHASPSAFQQEAERAILAHTPEAALSKTQAQVEQSLFGNPVAQWLGASPLHMALGMAGAPLLWGGLKAAGGMAARGVGSAVGAAGLDLGTAALGVAAGIPMGMFMENPVGFLGLSNPTGGGLGQSSQQQHKELSAYEQRVVHEALKQGGSQAAMEAYVRAHTGRVGAEGVTPGGSPSGMLGLLRSQMWGGHGAGSQGAFTQTIREAEAKFGPNWYGPDWEHNPQRGTGRAIPEQANRFLHEHLSGAGVGQASELIKKLREYEQLGPQGYAAKQQQESTNKFSEAVEKFAKIIEQEHTNTKNTAYTAGAAHQSLTRASLSTTPGMVLASYLSGRGGSGSTGSSAGTQDVSYSGSGNDLTGLSGNVTRWKPQIEAAARATGVPADIIAAVMQQESGGQAGVTSPAGAKGLMQLTNPGGLGVRNWSNPGENIMGGARELAKDLSAEHGNLADALAAYNAGPGAVAKYGGVPPYAETQAYVKSIEAMLSKMQIHVHVDGQKARKNAVKVRGQLS